MKSFFYGTLITLGLAFSGVSAHAQTASGNGQFGDGTKFNVTMIESGNNFNVTVSYLSGPSSANDLTIELLNKFGGSGGGGSKLTFDETVAPTGGTTQAWDSGFDSPTILEFASAANDSSEDIGPAGSFTGSFSILPGQDVKSFQVEISNTTVEESTGVFGNFVPDGASMALIVPGLLPLGVALRRRRSSKAQA